MSRRPLFEVDRVDRAVSGCFTLTVEANTLQLCSILRELLADQVVGLN